MEKPSALTEHDRKIAAARALIKTSSGFTKKDAAKHLKRLEKEKAEYIHLITEARYRCENKNGKTMAEHH